MSKIRKVLVLLIILSCTMLLAGCGVNLTLDSLNKYVSIGGVGSTTEATTYAENKMTDALASLNNIKTTYGNLTLDLGTEFSTIVTGMENKLRTSMGGTKLINADGDTTKEGEAILNSIVIEKDAVNNLLRQCADGVSKAVQKRLQGYDGGSTNTKALNFDGSVAPSATQSDINRALTILGYEIEDVEVFFYYANSYDDIANYNTAYEGSSTGSAYAASFISTDYYKAKSCNSNTWNPKTSTDADTTNKDFYYFSLNLAKLNDKKALSEGKGNEVPLLKKGCTGYQEIKVHMSPGYSISQDFSDCWGHTTAHKDCNKADSAGRRTAFNWCLNVSTPHNGAFDKSGDFKDLRGDMIHSANLITPLTPDLGYHMMSKDSNGYYTYYEGIVAGVRQLGCGSCSSCKNSIATDSYWGFISVGITFKHYDNDSHIDIREFTQTSTTSSSFKAFSALPADIADGITMEDIITDLTKVSSAKVVILKEDLSSCTSLKTASDIYNETKTLGKAMKFGSTSPFTILKDDKGQDFTIDLLDMVAKPTFQVKNAISEEAIPLYIGNTKVGTWYITTFHDDLANSTNVAGITSNGITSREKLQRFKVYQGSNNAGDLKQVYILYGLNDILYIDYIAAQELPDESHEYLPGFNATKLVFNLFSNNIFSYSGDKEAVEFKEDNVKLYNAENIVINTRTNVAPNTNPYILTNNYYASALLETGSNKRLQELKGYIRTLGGNSPLVLNTYLEGLYLPGQYEDERFVCLGRKLVFDYRWFENAQITENTPAFTIYTPTAEASSTDDMNSHFANELVSSTLQDRNVTIADTEYTISGLVRLPYKGQTDIIRNYSTTSTLATTSTFRDAPIYSGEFKTDGDKVTHGPDTALYALLAGEEPALQSIIKNAPKLFVWCTSANVNTQLVNYLNSPEFSYWQIWLNNNGYPNYLNDAESDNFIDEIVHQIEMTYDLTFDDDAVGKDLIIDTSGLDQLDDWINRQVEQKNNAIIDVILRIISIVLLVYGLLLLICYIIDVAVSGEGEGVLKKVTFNRMMTVTGLTKEERQSMSQKNEKGTYTTRAVSIGDLIPVILIMWAIATIVIIGRAYNIVDTLISLAEQITQIVRGAIGKE